MRIRQAFAVGLLGLVPALTGCLVHTRRVPKTRPADVVLDATLDQLLKQVETRYNAIQTMNASVEVVATTGGGHEGKETQYPSFSGYIFIRKPEDLRILLRVPFLGSVGLDMVSDGKTWKLWVPKKNLAMTGTSEVVKPSQNGLENLRPSVIFDSLLIHGLAPDQVVSLTQDVRIIEDKAHKELVEEPDYDLEILGEPAPQPTAPSPGHIAQTVRVIHIGRANLLPFQQDIYGPDGTVVTRAFYSSYQKFGDITFPTKIEIKRPQDQYSLTLTISKLTLNQPLENDQFEVNIPPNVPIKKMD